MSKDQCQLICSACGAVYASDEPRWQCECGSVLNLKIRIRFSPDGIVTGNPTMWRYTEAIPIKDDTNIISLGEGFTPLIEVEFDGRPVLIKQEHLCPSGSFKDRGASVLISKVKELGVVEVVEDSSGNAGSATAAYCKAAGIACTVFVPDGANPAKVARIEGYGARIVRVPGDRQTAANRARKAAASTYYASHAWNPFFLHGTKTLAYEICEQMSWNVPATLVLPVGNGTLLLGAHLGFEELKAAGITGSIPRLIAVQAAACAPLFHALRRGSSEIPGLESLPTVADGIAVTSPVRGRQVLEAVRATGGDVLAVEEDEIADTLAAMKRRGFDIEPTSAAGIAGLRRYIESAGHDEIVVSAFTGRGHNAA